MKTPNTSQAHDRISNSARAQQQYVFFFFFFFAGYILYESTRLIQRQRHGREHLIRARAAGLEEACRGSLSAPPGSDPASTGSTSCSAPPNLKRLVIRRKER